MRFLPENLPVCRRANLVRSARAYLTEARRRARALGLEVEWVHADAREFVRPGVFDLAISMHTSFGFFEDPADDLQMARNMYESLRPRGWAVMELMGKEVLARGFQERAWHSLPDGSLFLQERQISRPTPIWML